MTFLLAEFQPLTIGLFQIPATKLYKIPRTQDLSSVRAFLKNLQAGISIVAAIAFGVLVTTWNTA